MKYIQHKFMALMAMVALLMGVTACQDEGYEDVSGTASKTLWEVINSRQDLSQFAAVLRQNGFDKVLNSSGNFTVLAPSNNQMSKIESAKLGEVPGAHIAPLSYNKSTLDDMKYLTMYNGRQALLSEFSLSGEEIVCRNGFLRFAQGAARDTQKNLYEMLQSLSGEYEMAAFITSLGDSIMDKEHSVQIGIDPTTNQPIYDTVMVYYNPLFEDVPLNNNDSLISILLLDNENWNALITKYSRYMRKHVDGSKDPNSMDPTLDCDAAYPFGSKIDTVATTYATCFELVRDLSFSYEGATQRASKCNPETVGNVYCSRSGVEVTMDSAQVSETMLASNGRIEVASGVKIKLTNNKIKEVYVEAEDYYYTNESYVATLIDPRFRGSRYVKTYGIDSLRSYRRYVLDADGNRLKNAKGTDDSIQVVGPQRRYVYNEAQYCNPFGASVLGYKVNLFSCNYKIQWRHVVPGNQGSNYCNPDTLDVNYPKYLSHVEKFRAGGEYEGQSDSLNWPIGGVVRHIQKMYLSQPGDYPLEYSSDVTNTDFVKHPYPYLSFNGDYSQFRCLTDYDSRATISSSAKTDEVGAKGAVTWYRMGVNAGVGVDDPTFETPLVWCETYVDHANGVVSVDPETGEVSDKARFLSGICGVQTQATWRPSAAKYGNEEPTRVPRDIFMCLYNGEATVFVTSNPFGYDNARGNLTNYKGSIFLDYIHFIPVIEEDD